MTTNGMQKDVVKLVKDLVELDFDAIGAYDAAIERLENAVYGAQLGEFRDDHRRHVAELSEFLARIGEAAPIHGDLKRVLTKGRVLFGGLIGDRAILRAMKSNEDETNTHYERAVNHTGIDEALGNVLRGNLGDERRHRSWIEQQLAAERSSRAKLDRPSFNSIF